MCTQVMKSLCTINLCDGNMVHLVICQKLYTVFETYNVYLDQVVNNKWMSYHLLLTFLASKENKKVRRYHEHQFMTSHVGHVILLNDNLSHALYFTKMDIR